MAKETFSQEKVVAALTEMGYTNLNAETSADFLNDAGKCRLLVGKVQGEEAIKRTDPVYQERYRVRASKMLQIAMSSAKEEKTSNAAPAATITEASNPAPSEANKTEGNSAPVGKKKETTAMASKKKAAVAKTKGKKAAKKAATPKKDRAPGVIDRIVEVLGSGKNTAAQIAEKVAKRFPDREPEGIAATVKIQVTRLSKPKGEGGRGLKIKREKQEGTNELLYSL